MTCHRSVLKDAAPGDDEEKSFGWATDVPTGQRTITNAGQPPVLVRNISG